MGYRKLMYQDSSTKQYCDSICGKGTIPSLLCPKLCVSILYPPPPPPIPHHHRKTTTFMTITIAFLAASFLIVSAYFIYAKFYKVSRRRNNVNDEASSTTGTLDSLDEEHGNATVDHHVWYIRTVGLDASIIEAITAVRYKKDEGLIDGTDCSVCLSEFQEDESLRLLPKCSHAFHVSCIDTWLRSHTNCPMCRAPVMVKAEEESHVAVSESTGGVDEVGEGEFVEISLRDERGETSERVDDCSDDKASLEVVDDKVKSGNCEKKLKRLRSGCSSHSNGRTNHGNGSNSMKRSHSCNGKFVLCRPIRLTDSILPLRSI